MGNKDLTDIVLFGAVALTAGWCFLAGPCKGIFKKKDQSSPSAFDMNADNTKAMINAGVSTHPVPPIKSAQTMGNAPPLTKASQIGTHEQQLAGMTADQRKLVGANYAHNLTATTVNGRVLSYN